MFKFETLTVNGRGAELIKNKAVTSGKAEVDVDGSTLKGNFKIVENAKCIQASIVTAGALAQDDSVELEDITCTLTVRDVVEDIEIEAGASNVTVALPVASGNITLVDAGATGVTGLTASGSQTVALAGTGIKAGVIRVKIAQAVLATGTATDEFNPSAREMKVPEAKAVQCNCRANLVVADPAKPATTYVQLGEKDIVLK